MAAALPALPAPPPPPPIAIRQAVIDLQGLVVQIRHKLRTMIDWYIYPDVVPSDINEYDPRLLILQSRLRALATIDFLQLPYLIDHSDALAAGYLIQIVEQLQNSALGIQAIFVSRYDRDLQERRPFGSIWDTLGYREEQLKLVPQRQPSNPRRLRPEDLRPNELGNFCRGALEMSNMRDRGRISFLDKKDLGEENRRKLKAFGGAYLNWGCPECAFKVRYHVASSITSNIHTTDEVRDVDTAPWGVVQYRSSFLAKCHLYLPLSESGGRTSMSSGLSATTRRESNKYGCVFCVAHGRDLDSHRHTATFATAREFATHLAFEHRDPLPPSLLLHRYLIAVEGKLVDDRKRWDVNFV